MKRGRVTGVDRTFADVVCSLCGEQRLVSVAKKFTICKSCLRGYEGLYRSARQHGATQDQLVAWMRYPHCAICDRRLYTGKGKDGARGYAIDHDHNCCPSSHSCGRCIRGLLCHPCNMSLGGLEAMIERASLDVVLAYLNR